MVLSYENIRLTMPEVERLEMLVYDLFREILPGQKLTLKEANFGKRLMIGDPILISETSWPARFILSQGPRDMTGHLGFAIFFISPSINWRGRGEDCFSLGNTIRFTHFGRDRRYDDIKGFFLKAVEKMSEFASKHKVSFIMQEVMNDHVMKVLAASPKWTPTKCGTNQGHNDWSFFLDCKKLVNDSID